MRILIAEEALQTGKGHWPSYISGIARGFRSMGDEVDVLGHHAASTTLLAEVGGNAFFTRNCWLDSSSQGALGGILHAFGFRKELLSWLGQHTPYDWVCSLTMRLQHLMAFALLSRSGAVPSSTRFLLLFVQGFGLYAGPGKPSSFPRNLSTRLARLCFWLMRPAVESGRFIIAAETGGMQDELQRFTGLPVVLFPHPVSPPPPAFPSNEPGTMNDEQAITITCPGFARHEKGNDLLQDAAKELLARPGNERLRFVMQWPEPFEMPDGTLLGPDPALLSHKRVELLNENLDSEAYEKLLTRTDFVILPYRRNSYHLRVSRVAIEAASRGIPLIYTSETWTNEVVQLVGRGVEIEAETPKALVQAITEASEKKSELKSIAAEGAGTVAAFHSASEFRSRLLSQSQSNQS